MNKIRIVGEPVPMQRAEGGTVKLSTFIPLKIRKRGVRKVIVHPRDTTVGRSTGSTCSMRAWSRAALTLRSAKACITRRSMNCCVSRYSIPPSSSASSPGSSPSA
jgi:hypothetical protein